MSKIVLSVAAAMLIGFCVPVSAQMAGPEESMQQALFVAQNVGVANVSQIQLYDGKWQIQGRDPSGQNIKVYVDADTGGITYVDRWW